MRLKPVKGLISLSINIRDESLQPVDELAVPVLLIGGGPAGLSAAFDIAREGINVLLGDDKQSFGGKLMLQTHRFFWLYGCRVCRYALN